MTKRENEKPSIETSKRKPNSYDYEKYKSSKGYIDNQVNCVLSLDRNRQISHRNISELFLTFNKVLKNQTTNDFKFSLKESKEGFEIQSQGKNNIYLEKIDSLKLENPQSFLIVPMVSKNHCFCAVIRKTTEGISATLVNASKGGRRGDDRGNHVGYEEYIFNPQKTSQLLKIFSDTSLYNVVKDHGNAKTNSEIYELFEEKSDKRYILNVISRDQKDGNCFVKEPEKAIKYAFATRNFSKEELTNLRKPSSKDIFKPKWTPCTQEIHRLYIEQLKKENPEKAEVLAKKYEKYLKYKNFAIDEIDKNMHLSGRSMEYSDRIEFQDKDANPIGTAAPFKDQKWVYRDKDNKVIGYSEEKENKIEYFDTSFKRIGFSTREEIGEKHYDTSGKMIGFSRSYLGMKDSGNLIAREHKGQTAIDTMITKAKGKERTALQEKMILRKDQEKIQKHSLKIPAKKVNPISKEF